MENLRILARLPQIVKGKPAPAQGRFVFGAGLAAIPLTGCLRNLRGSRGHSNLDREGVPVTTPQAAAAMHSFVGGGGFIWPAG